MYIQGEVSQLCGGDGGASQFMGATEEVSQLIGSNTVDNLLSSQRSTSTIHQVQTQNFNLTLDLNSFLLLAITT